MKDERGLYYHPQPGNSRERVYVRRDAGGEILFRLWSADKPEIWEKHGWLPYSVIEMAASLYKNERNPRRDHLRLYDVNVARALLREAEKERGRE